jgi:hypothetical protein
MLEIIRIRLSFPQLRAALKLIAVFAAISIDGVFSPAH